MNAPVPLFISTNWAMFTVIGTERRDFPFPFIVISPVYTPESTPFGTVKVESNIFCSFAEIEPGSGWMVIQFPAVPLVLIVTPESSSFVKKTNLVKSSQPGATAYIFLVGRSAPYSSPVYVHAPATHWSGTIPASESLLAARYA